MGRAHIRRLALTVVGPMLVVGVAYGSDSSPVNQFEGTVVFKDDGRVAAGVPVVMAHATKGFLSFDDKGPQANGANETLFGIFSVPNGRYACTTVTDADGHFVVRDFAAADERWLIAAGDAQSGYALQTSFHPRDFANVPPRLELENAGYLELPMPKPSGDMQAYLAISLDRDPDARDAGESSAGVDDDLGEHVNVRTMSMWTQGSNKPRRIGPVPGGHRYRVRALGSSGSLPFTPVLYQRSVQVVPGETADATLVPQEGVAVAGRVSDGDDKPLAKVNVTIRTADGVIVGALTDRDGKYELRSVPTGTHTLQLLRHAKRTAPG
ncbi:MAG TPA: carboxypeptidase-like regulatory domain-containing protein [Phycisphaerae bacterium]|nr:carboxypeptidase-like regulatory domain-containing protein [Phycisphaerae bacterium]